MGIRSLVFWLHTRDYLFYVCLKKSNRMVYYAHWRSNDCMGITQKNTPEIIFVLCRTFDFLDTYRNHLRLYFYREVTSVFRLL